MIHDFEGELYVYDLEGETADLMEILDPICLLVITYQNSDVGMYFSCCGSCCKLQQCPVKN